MTCIYRKPCCFDWLATLEKIYKMLVHSIPHILANVLLIKLNSCSLTCLCFCKAVLWEPVDKLLGAGWWAVQQNRLAYQYGNSRGLDWVSVFGEGVGLLEAPCINAIVKAICVYLCCLARRSRKKWELVYLTLLSLRSRKHKLFYIMNHLDKRLR